MFTERFATPDGLARFVPVEHRPAAEEPDDRYPYYLTTGRVLAQYQSGAQTRRVDALNQSAPAGFVELHPDTAELESIVDGELIRVVSRRGVVEVPARVVDTIRPDTLFTPFHWAGAARANSATVDALDPISRMPEFKICAARLEKLPVAGTVIPQADKADQAAPPPSLVAVRPGSRPGAGGVVG
jgi:assimilatory nitrate reductase catalytic subunit